MENLDNTGNMDYSANIGNSSNSNDKQNLESVCNYIIQRFAAIIKPKKSTMSPWLNAKNVANALRNQLYNLPDIDADTRDRLFNLFSRQSWLNDYVQLESNNNYVGVYKFLSDSLKKSSLPTNIIAPGGERKGAIFNNAVSLKKDPKVIEQLGSNPAPIDKASITNYTARDTELLRSYQMWGRKFTIMEVGKYDFKNGYGPQDDFHIYKYILEIDDSRDKQYEIYGRLSKMYLSYPGVIETVLKDAASFTEEELEKMGHYIGTLTYEKDKDGQGHVVMKYDRAELFAAKAAREYDKEKIDVKYFDKDGKTSLYLPIDSTDIKEDDEPER